MPGTLAGNRFRIMKIDADQEIAAHGMRSEVLGVNRNCSASIHNLEGVAHPGSPDPGEPVGNAEIARRQRREMGGPRSLIQVCEPLALPQARDREINALDEAMGELKLKPGTMVTRGESETLTVGTGVIEVVPGWRFLPDLLPREE